MARTSFGSRRDVAEYLGVPVATLERWATRDAGPAFVKIGRHTRYRWADVELWIAAQRRGGSQTGGAA